MRSPADFNFHKTSTREENMVLSKFILRIGKEIEEKSGLYLNFAKGNTRPIEEWISEDEISRMKCITLRTAKESQNEEVMKLPKFNPSFPLKERGRIRCRVPGCIVPKPREPNDSSEKNKQDLFLCDKHRGVLANRVLRCAKENASLDVENYTHEDFNGYTNLIELLEKAFNHVIKKSLRSSTDSILAEVFLNTRNFLVITNALLNPDEDNANAALIPYMIAFLAILVHLESNPTMVRNLLATLREVANVVFCFFGVVYPWVFMGNPGAQVGAGIGLLLGFFGGAWYAFFPAWIFATSIVGLVAGRLIGGGSYDWNRETTVTNYRATPLYHAYGNVNGELSLAVI